MAHKRNKRRPPAKPVPRKRGQVAIREIGGQGDGVGVLEGERVYAPLTAPGDIAIIEAQGERGSLVELVEASPHRAAPPCEHFGRCGGCSLQHVNAEFYRTWKGQRIVEALARAGLGDARVAEVIATPAASRRRATFAVAKTKEGAILGFNARHSSDVTEIAGCCILHPDLLAKLPALQALAQKIPDRKFDLAVTLCQNGLDVDIVGKVETPNALSIQDLVVSMRAARVARLSLNSEPLATIAPPVVEFDGIPVALPPGSFLQASKEGESALLALVNRATEGKRKIADLFSGCGAFALPLARTASVYAADSGRTAVAALSAAAAEAQRSGLAINPVRTEARDLFERPLTASELDAFDAVVFDPPRAGASAQAEELAKSHVKTVIGVSCNAITFARDAAILSQGGYKVIEVTPVDQFVYSAHVELVGVFRR